MEMQNANSKGQNGKNGENAANTYMAALLHPAIRRLVSFAHLEYADVFFVFPENHAQVALSSAIKIINAFQFLDIEQARLAREKRSQHFFQLTALIR